MKRGPQLRRASIAQAERRPPNLRHLRVFLAVADAGSLAAAGYAAPLSQPAMTQALQNLERQFDAELLTRRKTGMLLTSAGKLLLVRIRRAFDLLATGLTKAQHVETKMGPQDEILNLVTTSQLKALIEVARHGSFAQAAKAVGRAEPTLHRAARDLEQVLRALLFERTSFGVQPTRRAMKLAMSARLFFHEIDQARAELAALSGVETGATVVGALPLARARIAPKAVSDFSRDYPQHSVSIQEGAYEALLLDLRRGDVDFLFGALRSDLNDPNIIQEHVFDDTVSIAMRKGHPLANMPKLQSKNLKAFSWVAPRRGTPLRAHFDSLFAADAQPPEFIECNSLSAARVLLMDSNRLMLLSDSQSLYERKSGMLVSRPVPQHSIIRPIGFTYRKSWLPTDAQSQLTERFKRVALGAL